MTDWLMLEGEEYLHAADNGRLDPVMAGGIPCVPVNITSPAVAMGIAFPEDNLAQVLPLLGLDAEKPYRKIATNRSGTYLISWQGEGITPMFISFDEREADRLRQVQALSMNNMDQYQNMLPVLTEYSNLLGLNIRSHNPHGESYAVYSGREDTLFIHFWSVPRVADWGSNPRGAQSRDGSKILSCFGVPLAGGQSDAIRPSGAGSVIMDDDGHEIAEVVGGNNLFVLFDLPHGSSAPEALNKVLEAYCLHISGTTGDGDLAESIRNLRDAILEREEKESRDRYVSGRRQQLGIDGQREDISKRLASVATDIQKHHEALIELSRRHNELRLMGLELECLEEEANAEGFGVEYDALREVDGVRRVAVRDGRVDVYTDRIYIDHDGERYDIGEFNIRLYYNGTVKALNLSRTTAVKAHPIVDRDGHIAFGDVGLGVAELMAEYQLAVVAQITIQLLGSLGEGSVEDLKEFPVVEASLAVEEDS